ncbi:MAG: hypothetical protein ABGY95_02205 [Rubritalea sp.]|uniref:hypothetical protein n=1 Tax=Rubritalea sp. TaxID=2109375 RepID=UPI003242E702
MPYRLKNAKKIKDQISEFLLASVIAKIEHSTVSWLNAHLQKQSYSAQSNSGKYTIEQYNIEQIAEK